MSIHNRVIYQLLDSRTQGGIESHVFILNRWLNNNGFKSDVVFLNDYGPHPMKNQLIQGGFSYHCLTSYDELYYLFKRSDCLINTHGYKAGILGRILGKLTKTPVVSTYHSGDLGQGIVRLYSLLDDLSSGLADQIISVSGQIAERLPVPSHQISNFVSNEKINTERGKAIAFVGRLSPEKDPESFARATKNLLGNFKCNVYGDGPLRQRLVERYSHLNYFGLVDMSKHWKEIGLLCISSQHEGLPLVALEAMARGIPVVSYKVGALPELIEHTKTGWLVSRNDEKGLTNAIQKWRDLSGTEKAAMSVAAHYRIKEYYCDDVIVSQIVEIYTQALHQQNNLGMKLGRKAL